MRATGPGPRPPGSEERSSPPDGDAHASRPLSTPVAIGIAGLTAAVVIGAGVFLAERAARPRLDVPDAIAPIPAVAAPPSIAPVREAPASSTAPPALSAAPPALSAAPPALSAAPAMASSAPAEPASPPVASVPAASLSPQFGYLVVRSEREAHVYVNGVDVGLTNRANEARCGMRYVRVGTGENPPSWFGPGQSLRIRCQKITEMKADAAP